jgi:hypothetical protein
MAAVVTSKIAIPPVNYNQQVMCIHVTTLAAMDKDAFAFAISSLP